MPAQRDEPFAGALLPPGGLFAAVEIRRRLDQYEAGLVAVRDEFNGRERHGGDRAVFCQDRGIDDALIGDDFPLQAGMHQLGALGG